MKFSTVCTATALALALLASPPALAEAQEDSPKAEAQSNGPALWKVADEDTTIYLFGTVHALPADIEWYDEEIAAALAASDTLVTEIRMDSASEREMQQAAMEKSVLPQGTTLRSLLNPEQTAAYESALAELSLPPVAFDRFEPWMAGLTLTMLPLMKEGISPDTGVEKVLLRKAGDKPQDALETAEFQLNIFDTLPQDKQVAFLMEAVEGMDEAKETLDAMIAEWVEGDADALAELMNEGLDDPEIAEALLYDRNANWAEWIVTRLDAPGTVFVAVGAGHLAGNKSVQDQLAKREIEVQRVR
ncbi:MAG: TraB/GumN family protein [Erythrobacter sp.]|uniref:TraB/GumN family protein n=1 Tax=Erythrobacter sp. TaxID=1042 RepID=UPI002633AAAE|nr:TraB/GumN family protein [Erythrobacter sp.]MDJ0977676.1 TraB/GumN family protein [Erythrobacter sp.]